MYEGKKNSDKWFPVIFIDSTDFKTRKTGIVFGGVTAKYHVEGATSQSTYTVLTADWKEAGNGEYWINIGASEFTTEAKYTVTVQAAASLDASFVVEVRDKTIAELIDDVGTLLTRIPGALNISGGVVDADAVKISTSATAADALELISLNAKGADHKILISTDDQDLKTTLHVDMKAVIGNYPAAVAFKSACDNINSGNFKVNVVRIWNDSDTDVPQRLRDFMTNGIASSGGLFSDAIKAQINAEVDEALNTAIPVTPIADSINDIIKTLDGKLPTGTISDFENSTDEVLANVKKIEDVSLSGKVGDNMNVFFQNGGADTTKIVDNIGTGTALTAQEVRDSMKLAPTAGIPAAGSIDLAVDDIQAKTDQLTFTGSAVQADVQAVDGSTAHAATLDAWVGVGIGTDNKTIISEDDQDLTASLHVDTQAIAGVEATATNLGANITAIRGATDALHFNGDNVKADIEEISGDATAAVNLESDYDGTGYNKANSEIGIVALAEDIGETAQARVHLQVSNIVNVEDLPELLQGTPPSIESLGASVTRLRMALVNKGTDTASEKSFYNAAGTKITKKAISDDGTTYVESKMISGA